MAKGILGKKVGMLQCWDESGKLVPVTAVQVGPCPVLQVKTKEKDGYSSLQIGFVETKAMHLSKPEKEHQKISFEKNKKYMRELIEVRDFFEKKEVGDLIQCDSFSKGEKVFVRAKSKGKGFQGVIKRYGFHGGNETHGSTFHRGPGAIGACAYPGEVQKGKKMPGRMGGKYVSVKNVEVVNVISDDHMMFLKGPIPGHAGSSVYIYQN